MVAPYFLICWAVAFCSVARTPTHVPKFVCFLGRGGSTIFLEAPHGFHSSSDSMATSRVMDSGHAGHVAVAQTHVPTIATKKMGYYSTFFGVASSAHG